LDTTTLRKELIYLSQISPEMKIKIWIMYLRKSRQDDPNETVEEVLAKHETMLQEWAMRELGHPIPEEYIFREVVSGERISDRREMQKVLRAIENPEVAGVLCRDPSRLSRGDLLDCGTMISTLQFTSTLVATPMMVYNMEDKMERRFFQDELLRGNSYLEYTKEVLYAGRTLAVTSKGAYIGSVPPYGYTKARVGKLCTLVPHETEADVVRMIFDLYVNHDMTFHSIGRKLDAMGIKPRTGDAWRDTSIRQIIANHHYDGKVTWGKRKKKITIVDGKQIVKRNFVEEDKVTIVDGIHPALVDHETFVKANEKRTNNPRIIRDLQLSNPLAGLLVCAKCGHTMRRAPYPHADDRYKCCYYKPPCMKSIKMKDVHEAVITALEQAELPNLKAQLNSDQGNAAAIQQKILDGLLRQMEEYRQQEEMQYELLETKKYTPELFEKRNAVLREKMKQCEIQIYETKRTMPKAVDYAERIIALEDAIRALRDNTLSSEEQNRLLKKIVERIEISTFPLPKRNTGCTLDIYLLLSYD
jgi:hypothetical protein